MSVSNNEENVISKDIFKQIQSCFNENNSKASDNSKLEESILSLNSTSTSQSEVEQVNEFLNSIEYYQFEENFRKYYVDSRANCNGNFDKYVKSALKLITLIPSKKLNFSQKVEKIAKQIQEVSEFSLNLNQKNKQNKKLLVLDLDETLIHADIDFLLNKNKYEKILYFDQPYEKNIQIPLILRPHLYKFLDYISQYFEIYIFTASEKEYADTILDYIEKDKKYFSKRFYRDSCIFVEPGLYIKDLRIFKNYPIKDIIIVDNSLFSFANQINNGILVTSFYDDENDDFLECLMDYLDNIRNLNDIREANKESFNFDNIRNEILKSN